LSLGARPCRLFQSCRTSLASAPVAPR